MFLFFFGHWYLKERITVPAQVSRQQKLLQTSNWINLQFHSSWEPVVFVQTGATVTCIWNCTCPGCRTAGGSCAMGQGAGGAYIAMSDGILWLSFPTQAEGKAVLITGCDKGFGHALAKCLHAKGFTVFAGCLLMVSSEIDQNFSLIREKCFSGQSIFICSLHLPWFKTWERSSGWGLLHLSLLHLPVASCHSCNCELFRAGLVCQLHVCTVACAVWYCSLLEASQQYHSTLNKSDRPRLLWRYGFLSSLASLLLSFTLSFFVDALSILISKLPLLHY